MQLPRIDVQRDSLASILMSMKSGALQVPRFQRDFVWPLTKTRALLDSMYKEFPIGTFFLWRAPQGSPPLSRPLDELGIPGPQADARVSYILDGQQRLSSLYCAVNGVRIGSRDYGRICIDLETATRFDRNKEEDFNEDIFVYLTADNRRFVAVQDLVGSYTLHIYDNVPMEWKPAFTKANTMFQMYPFSVVWIQEQTLADAIVIFQRINQSGKPLSRFDLVCANVWREDFDFRKKVADINKEFERKGFGQIEETIFTQTFALIEGDQCTTLAELSLTTEQIERKWAKVIRCLQLAIDFVVNNLGVRRFEYLPYRGHLVVLAYFFYHRESSNLTVRDHKMLWDWFWRVALSERYSATSPSKMAEDAKKMRAFLLGEDVTFNYPPTVTGDAVARTKMSSTASVLRNAVLCLLTLKRPLNFKDNSPVNLGDSFFANIKQVERHHIFPAGYLRGYGISPNQSLLLANFCFIPADLNKHIGSRPPLDYMQEYRGENPQFRKSIESHLIPFDPKSSLWKKGSNAFYNFVRERSEVLAQELLQVLESGPHYASNELIDTRPTTEVDLLEIRLRNFIDERLTAAVGADYWNKAIPNEIVRFAANRNPNTAQSSEGLNKNSTGRIQLDYCDIKHYLWIISANWNVFDEYLQSQTAFQEQLEAFRFLRNSVQHNRKPTEHEQKAGESAVLWLRERLEEYEVMLIAEQSAEDDESGEADELDDDTSGIPDADIHAYEVTMYGTTVTKQSKQYVMLHVVKSLCDHGVEPEAIANLIYWRPILFFDVPGKCHSEEFLRLAGEKLKKINGRQLATDRWFLSDDELIIQNGKTYAFTNRWGNRWLQALKLLKNNFPDANLDYKQVEKP